MARLYVASNRCDKLQVRSIDTSLPPCNRDATEAAGSRDCFSTTAKPVHSQSERTTLINHNAIGQPVSCWVCTRQCQFAAIHTRACCAPHRILPEMLRQKTHIPQTHTPVSTHPMHACMPVLFAALCKFPLSTPHDITPRQCPSHPVVQALAVPRPLGPGPQHSHRRSRSASRHPQRQQRMPCEAADRPDTPATHHTCPCSSWLVPPLPQ